MVKSMTDEVVNQFDDNPYDESDNRHDAWALRHTEYRELIISIANDNYLKYDTIMALKVLVNDVMSSNAFMSNQTPPKRSFKSMFEGESTFNQLEYTSVSIEECIEMFLASVDPLDTNKNIVYQIVNEILNHTMNFTLTRTVGKEREGVVNRIEHTKQTQEIKELGFVDGERKSIKKDGIF